MLYADVGGGNSPDSAQHTLSNISLRWMIEQVKREECNILFDDGVPVSEDGPTGDCDEQDAVQKITDKLWLKPWWWILEIFPTSYTYQNETGKWVTTWW